MNNYIKFIEEMYLRGVITKETYEKASDKDKAKIDKFEEGLSKLDTIEEKLDYTLDAILKEILGR